MQKWEFKSNLCQHVRVWNSASCFRVLNSSTPRSIRHAILNDSKFLTERVGYVYLEWVTRLPVHGVPHHIDDDFPGDVRLPVPLNPIDYFQRPLRLIHRKFELPQRPKEPESLHLCQPRCFKCEISGRKHHCDHSASRERYRALEVNAKYCIFLHSLISRRNRHSFKIYVRWESRFKTQWSTLIDDSFEVRGNRSDCDWHLLIIYRIDNSFNHEYKTCILLYKCWVDVKYLQSIVGWTETACEGRIQIWRNSCTS